MDWIEHFLALTSDVFSPPIFRQWAAIGTLAAVLERRIYTQTKATRRTYPNLYLTLTGDSGCGKTEALNLCHALWAQVPDFKIGPDNLTNAAFYDALYGSLKVNASNGHSADIYSALTVWSPELGVLIPRYDMEFLYNLSHLYDNVEKFKSQRRDKSRTVEIEAPTVNIMAGVTPRSLGDILPESAWGQGFTSRMLFVHGNRDTSAEIDILSPGKALNLEPLRQTLGDILSLKGEVNWTPPAHDAIYYWYNHERAETAPQHFRLKEYNTRRHIHLIKLSMISAVAAGRGVTILEEDFLRARDWLYEVESAMPDVFRAMSQKSDDQIMQEMHYHFWAQQARMDTKAKTTVNEQEMYEYLRNKVESHKIKFIIEVSERSGLFRRGTFPGEWLTQPISSHNL